jgi:hypothetical protein
VRVPQSRPSAIFAFAVPAIPLAIATTNAPRTKHLTSQP